MSLEISDIGGAYSVEDTASHLRVIFDRLQEKHGDLSGQVKVLANGAGKPTVLCEGDKLNLNSARGKDDLAKRLSGLHQKLPLADWKTLIHSVAVMVLRQYREGEPVVTLSRQVSTESRPFIINPFVMRNTGTVIYGAAGSVKTYVSLWLAMQYAAGVSLAGIRTAGRGRVMFLDWESDQEDLQARAERLRQGHPELAEALPLYRRCLQSLSDDLGKIQRVVSENKISLVVIDSVALACGGRLTEPETAIKLFNCLRRLNCAAILIGHPPRQYDDKEKEQDIYGSIFFRNCGRSMWEMKRVYGAGESSIAVSLTHNKNNFGREHDPIGLRVDFNGGAVIVSEFDLATITDDQDLPLPSRIRTLLEDGTPRTAQQIIKALGTRGRSTQTAISNAVRDRKISIIKSAWPPQYTVLNATGGLTPRKV